jgi:hypothetical protein
LLACLHSPARSSCVTAVFIAVTYRLAPQHRWPACFDEHLLLADPANGWYARLKEELHAC